MESIQFEESNLALGKDQPEYTTLYAHLTPSLPSKPVVFGFKLTPEELETINRTGEIWLEQLTFGKNFQPIGISVDKPPLKKVDLAQWAEEQRIIRNS